MAFLLVRAQTQRRTYDSLHQLVRLLRPFHQGVCCAGSHKRHRFNFLPLVRSVQEESSPVARHPTRGLRTQRRKDAHRRCDDFGHAFDDLLAMLVHTATGQNQAPFVLLFRHRDLHSHCIPQLDGRDEFQTLIKEYRAGSIFGSGAVSPNCAASHGAKAVQQA